MTEAANCAKAIESFLPNIHGGSLRFWGDWFGKPCDNFHKIVRCEAEQDRLILGLQEKSERLTVWSPREWTVNEKEFEIADAERVRWEWNYYPDINPPDSICYREYERRPEGIYATESEPQSKMFLSRRVRPQLLPLEEGMGAVAIL